MHGYFLREGGSVGSLEVTQKLIFEAKVLAQRPIVDAERLPTPWEFGV